ncbi:hypothetical protein N7453_010330 [Penicillium expansum]|nr:hypothetical protein N7453_010330 [Penicillium expansum]
MYSVGLVKWLWRAQRLSHDFVKELARESPVLRDPPPALSHGGYGEMVVERDGERKKRRRRKEKEGWGRPFIWSRPTYLP